MRQKHTTSGWTSRRCADSTRALRASPATAARRPGQRPDGSNARSSRWTHGGSGVPAAPGSCRSEVSTRTSWPAARSPATVAAQCSSYPPVWCGG
jgi:hypothetical protein